MNPVARRSIQEAALWGDVFEIAAKSGLLAYLKAAGVITAEHPELAPWIGTKYSRICDHFSHFYRRSLPESVDLGKSYLEHLTFLGWTTGYTVMREWWKKSGLSGRIDKLTMVGLWSPLEFPDRSEASEDVSAVEKATTYAEGRDRRVREFLAAFSISQEELEDPSKLTGKGMPAQADFMIVLEERKRRGPNQAHLVCVEFSLLTPTALKDFGKEEAHLEEVRSHIYSTSRRGFFSDLSAQIADVDISISEDMPRFLKAFTRSDKPLYKLTQAASYVTNMVDLLDRYETINTTAIAMTNDGIESISGVLNRRTPSSGAFPLIRALGQVYATKTAAEAKFQTYLDDVFATLVRSMPRAMRKSLETFLSSAVGERKSSAQIEESVTDYLRPTQRFSVSEALEWLKLSNESDRKMPLQDYLRPQALEAALEGAGRDGGVTIRDLNSVVIESTINNAPAGRITAVGLLGHPGIGKTTSTIKALRNLNKSTGENSLFLYFSPRTVINESVTQDVTKGSGQNGGGEVDAISLNTSYRLIGAAADYGKYKGWGYKDEKGNETFPSSAVAYSCSFASNHAGRSPVPSNEQASCLYLTMPEADEAMNHTKNPSGLKGYDHAASVRKMTSARQKSVMGTLAQACRVVAELNTEIPIISGTAAIQGMRRSSVQAQASVEKLASIFGHTPDKQDRNGPAARAIMRKDRLKFAKSRPVIVVMVDELAGDGAGAPMAEALAKCLYDALIEPFKGEKISSPFRIILLLADASLSSPEAFNAFLSSTGDEDSEGRNPARVLLSPKTSSVPFSIKNVEIRSLAAVAKIPFVTLVSADAYPALSLTLCYDLGLRVVDAQQDPALATHKLIKKIFSESDVHDAVSRIQREIARTPDNEQIIYYAQDRKHLAEVRAEIIQRNILGSEDICSITSELSPQMKRRLTDTQYKGRGRRDSFRLFLMTSAGARGISLPLATAIMIKIPRFSIETALMEVIQVIYRGRGGYVDSQGNFASGDDLPRRLIFCIDDYVRNDDEGTVQELQWSRQKIDVATVLSILRGAIMTRISGSARSRRFDGAIVPVGSTGVENASDTLSGSFLKLKVACGDLLRRSDNKIVQGLAGNVIKGIEEFCRSVHLSWDCREKPEEKSSNVTGWVKGEPLKDLGIYLSLPSRTLIPNARDQHSSHLIRNIPEHVYFVGPLIYLNMQGGQEAKAIATEMFSFPGDSEAKRGADALREACDAIIGVSSDKKFEAEFDKQVIDSAKICSNCLNRDTFKIVGQKFDSEKTISSKGLWIAMPSDWTRFLRVVEQEGDNKPDTLRRPAEWQSVLHIALSGQQGGQWHTPFEPYYERQPFMAASLSAPPTGLERAFDSRYLASTAEFNMLNLVLCGG